jgi:DDE superfamily endonuclease
VPPHRVEYWLNAKPADPVAFPAHVAAVCEAYPQAPAVAQDGGHVISTEEKTGIQALARAAPTLPMKPGLVERPEYAYLRHGPQCLIAHFDVATGEVIAPTIGPSRTEEDFAAHIARTIAIDPEASWLFIVDQLNTHKSEALVRLVASACDITEDLGEKEKWGILQSMSTRAAFLSEASHRIRFLYTPKHTSWLNQIELWFSILVRRLLRRGNFTSVEDLRERILAFIAYFNKTMAKPFQWTYKGRPLTV